MKKRKLSDSAPGPQKAPKTPKSNEKITKSAYHKDDRTENEVSSSSEADHVTPAAAAVVDENACPAEKTTKPSERVKGLLEKYILVTPTQKAEISTSCSDSVVDLTEDNEAEAKVCEINDEGSSIKAAAAGKEKGDGKEIADDDVSGNNTPDSKAPMEEPTDCKSLEEVHGLDVTGDKEDNPEPECSSLNSSIDSCVVSNTDSPTGSDKLSTTPKTPAPAATPTNPHRAKVLLSETTAIFSKFCMGLPCCWNL